MFGRIGSGLTPPKYGLRSWWISVTRIRPPASSREIQPAPAPYIGSTSTGHVGGPEGVEVDRPADEPLVALVRVVPLDQPGRLGVRERPALDRRPAVRRDPRLDDLQDLRAGGRRRSAT